MSYIIFPNDGTIQLSENIPSLNNATITSTDASADTFKCPTCDSTFRKLKLLRGHERRVHKRYVLQREVTGKYKCEYCEKTFLSYQTRSRHRIVKHGVKKEVKRYENGGIHVKFDSEQDFNEWLTSEQQQSKSHFVKARGARKHKSYLFVTYKCNRSGKFVSRNTGKRKLKKQGSQKLGKNCSAMLNVKIFKTDNSVKVTYFNEHNHELALNHLPLPTVVKEAIAEKILNGECNSKILNDVKGNVEVPENRCQLVTRKDINNIKSRLMDTGYLPSLQLNSCNSDGSPNVIDQNINTSEDGDNRTEILNKLIAIHNKVAFMPGMSNSTATNVMRALERIEVLLDKENNSFTK